jgi:hypothetical protein
MRYRLGKNTRSLGGAAAMVVSTMVLPAGAANLLVNPGFESPTSTTNPNDTVTGWTTYGSELRANYENHTAGGEWSMWEQTFQSYGGVYQNVSGIQAGTDYTLTAYEYFEAQYASTGAVSDLELTWYGPGTIGSGASEVGSPAETLNEPNTISTGVWTQYSITNAVAPAGATQVQVSFDFTNGSNVAGQLAGFTDDADLEGIGTLPTTDVWAINSSGDWNFAGNWTTASVPNAPGVEADFFGEVTSPTTVYTNAPITAGFIHFNNANEYEVTGTGNLTLQGAGSNGATVEVDTGTDELDLPLTIASNTVFNVATGANLIIGNPMTINSGKSVTQTGTGTVTYQSIVTLQSNASIVFANSTYAHELVLASGATATVGGPVLEVDSLSNLGTVNVKNDELLINYGSGTDPIASVVSEIISGFANGSWTGTGIMSSNAQTNSASYGLGYADAADPGNPANLAPGTIEVLYTLLGDANLDGKVNGTDFNLMATNFNQAVTDGWDKGDFNYDNKVNGNDFVLLASNFNQFASQTGVSSADAAALNAFAEANGIALTSVPEPASLGLLVVAGLGVLRRRRRS